MTARTYSANLLSLCTGLLVIGLILYFGAGSRWFSFYGWASLALIAVTIGGTLIFKRYRTLGLRRWPALLVMFLIASACLIQIGFWAMFFSTDAQGLGLAAGRSMILPLIEPWLPLAGGISAIAVVWLLGRGVYDN